MGRNMVRFWLDMRKDDESFLHEFVQDLKSQRLFAATIRNALLLIYDLREGRVDMLLEMFPFVREAVRAADSGSDDGQKEIHRRLDGIEQWMATYVSSNNRVMSDVPAGAPKPLGGLRPVTPRRDDDDDVLVLKKSDGKESVENFLKSAMALQ